MTTKPLGSLPLLVLVTFAGSSFAQAPPASYARNVKPFLAKFCLECHSADKSKGGLNLESFKTLMEGGDNGPVLVPGKPDESRMVLAVEGKDKPFMPPKKAKQPAAQELAVLRAWIAAGARDDSGSVKTKLPDIKPSVPVRAAAGALAYHPDGKRLAVGVYKEVVLIDVASGDVDGKLPGQTEKVTALAFSRNGRTLAVASGSVGVAGEIRLYPMPASGVPDAKPAHILTGHKDLIHDLTWGPDNKTLASGGYDRLIKLWDAPSGKELKTLKDHSDTVHGLAFSPDGKLLASAAADRAVKIWDPASGKRLYTLSESTDWLYAVAWSPDGRHVAAGGVDKSIRVWQADAAGGKLSHSVFAHEEPITRLIYAGDGKTLYSLSEDRTAKVWDSDKMTERKVYAKQPETVLALAVRPDRKQLALGRSDGAVLLFDEETGTIQSEPLPVKPKPPQLARIAPAFGPRGIAVRLRAEGKALDTVTEALVNYAGAATTLVHASRKPNALEFDLSFPADTPPGVYQIRVKNTLGQSAAVPFTVDPFPTIEEHDTNDALSTSQKLNIPATVIGALGKAGDVDYYRFEAKAGQQIGVQALGVDPDSQLDAVLYLTDETGKVLAEGPKGILGFTAEKAASYFLSIHDREYRGGKKSGYHLNIGDLPVVAVVFPLGLQRGTEADIRLEGVGLENAVTVRMKAAADAELGSFLPVPVHTSKGIPLGKPRVVVGEFPEVVRPASAGSAVPGIPVPGTANGRIDRPGATETWRFPAKQGQRLIVEVHARRLGTPLDTYIEVLDAAGRPVPRAKLHSLAKTFVTFRDHDSAGAGIRVESWNELAINDILLVGNELLRIHELPKNPDDDMRVYSVAGRRVGLLDTTPTHHSMGVPMYKVSIHPPGTTLPANGLPEVTLYYRNDDGGHGYDKDSRLFFDPPADGEYQVRIGDTRGQGGSAYAYRLTVRPPRPSYTVSFRPAEPAVWKGGALPIAVTATRIDGFEGPIALRLENLPAGLSAPLTSIPEGETTTAFALWADATAANPAAGGPPLKLVARSTIDGKEVVREAAGKLPRVLDKPDIVTTVDQSELAVQPGGQVRLTVKIDRKNGFSGRVPIDVQGLPHGVRVLDIGLNGILIIPTQNSRTIVIYAEPWVKPTEHPFVVLARHEKKNAEFAARSVLLRVGEGK